MDWRSLRRQVVDLMVERRVDLTITFVAVSCIFLLGHASAI